MVLRDIPKLIDEPTAGLDPEERMRFKNIVAEVKGGRTILISTHIVDDIDVVCDHILVISQGRLLASGKKEAICRCAQGLVYCLPRNLQKNLVGDWSLENIFEEGGEEWIRILLSLIHILHAVAQIYAVGVPTMLMNALGSVLVTLLNSISVSYTHLDVYKRQIKRLAAPFSRIRYASVGGVRHSVRRRMISVVRLKGILANTL